MSAVARSASERPGPAPVDPRTFDRLIEGLGLFEPHPHVAVAVSGGADSMALACLAVRWAERRGGTVSGLVVDHRLRAGSRQDALRAAGWLAARGVRPVILTRDGPRPASRLQAVAREARYRLLCDWCREAGVLHLLLGHHREDQVETVAMRRARRSGPAGLAGMPAVREVRGVRILRPLLSMPKARLVAHLRALRQPWLEDPSNADPAFARVRLRRTGALERNGLGRMADTAARRRVDHERALAAWLAAHARIDPAGVVSLAWPALRAAPEGLARDVLVAALGAVSGRAYPPRSRGPGRLIQALCTDRREGAQTLAGCVLRPQGEAIVIGREPAAVAPPLELGRDGEHEWDGRFLVVARRLPPGISVGALGVVGWRQHPELRQLAAARRLPHPARLALPAVHRDGRLVAVPPLGFEAEPLASEALLHMTFRPRRPLAGPAFGTGAAAPLFQTTDRLCYSEDGDVCPQSISSDTWRRPGAGDKRDDVMRLTT